MAEQNQGVAGNSGGNPVVGFAFLGGLVLIGYLVFSAFTGSDRSEVRACIEASQRMDGNGTVVGTCDTKFWKDVLAIIDTNPASTGPIAKPPKEPPMWA